MSLLPDKGIPIKQDMPPPGGYPKFNIGLEVRRRGLNGWQAWLGASVMIAFGFYRVGQKNQEDNKRKLAERQTRYAIAPYLQAEADREFMVRELINLKKEAEIMKDVKGWKVGQSPYFSGKWMPPMTNTISYRNQK